MAFIPVPDTIQLEVRAFLNSVPVENTFYYLSAGTIDQALLDAVAEAARDYVEEEAAGFNTNWIFKEVYARDLSDSTFLSSLASATGAITGSAADPLPNNVTFALKRSSGFSGRSARGRIYWMGIATSYMASDNMLATISANGLITWVEALDAVVSLEGVTPVIVSRFNNLLPRTEGVTYPIADWSYSDLRVDTLRSRLPTA